MKEAGAAEIRNPTLSMSRKEVKVDTTSNTMMLLLREAEEEKEVQSRTLSTSRRELSQEVVRLKLRFKLRKSTIIKWPRM
jgi:hypothetical protein